MTEGRPSVAARMWAYRAFDVPVNVFDFTVSRHRDGPDEILAHFRGPLMADCWSGFQKIELRSDARIRRAACWAHARRKVLAGRTSHPQQASVLLAMIRELYDLEERGKALALEERRALRQRESRRVLERLRAYVESEAVAGVLPKSVFAEALNYLRNHGEALQVFLSDPRLPLGRVGRWRGGLGFGLLPFQGFPVCGAITACHAPFPPSRSSNRTCGATASGSLTKLRPSRSAWGGVGRAA